MRLVHTSTLAAALFAVVVSALAPVTAADTNAAPVVQATDDAQGCPGKMNGGPCCASCQGEQAAADAAPAKAPCPCQERARRLREAAERAKQQ